MKTTSSPDTQLYAQVYYHRKNLAARALLGKLIKRALHVIDKGAGSIAFIDEATGKWLTGEKLTVEEYLSLDDIQLGYHIKRWLKDKDQILADLSHRFLNRRIFKASRINTQVQSEIDDIEKQVRQAVSSLGFDPDYYVAVESTGFVPYDYYRPDSDHPQTNIVVRTDNGEVKELSQLSLAVEALVKGNHTSYWLIYPQEATEAVEKIRTKLNLAVNTK